MADTKYGNLIHSTELIRDIPHYTGYSMLSHEGELNEDCSIGYHCVSEPICFERPHAHDFVELLFFLGGDPTDIRDLGAEVEITLGEEQEKHLLTTAGVVSIPAGLTHCPIDIRNVTKPIVFLEVSLTRVYKPDAGNEDEI
ncbi:MAG: hypothetical protein JSU79_09920 [Dehalococcoidales bacterium]|nr:MAG: hypothetical protein JSU79_09920 [Dehalococcoidales bacterium]